VDTSGTAKAIVASFKELGIEFEEDQIEMVRTPEQQTARMLVPEEHLPGHAFHTYELTSPDGMVKLKFEHNVCGRSIYAEVRVCSHSLCSSRAVAHVRESVAGRRRAERRAVSERESRLP